MPTSQWNQRVQAQTLRDAERWGEGWTLADLEFVEAMANEPDAEVARALGRTLFSIQTIKHAIRAGRVRPSEGLVRRSRTANARSYRGWTEGDGDE